MLKLKAEPISPKLRQPFPIGRRSDEMLERVIQRLQISKLHPDSVDFISKVSEQDQVQRFLGPLWAQVVPDKVNLGPLWS